MVLITAIICFVATLLLAGLSLLIDIFEEFLEGLCAFLKGLYDGFRGKGKNTRT